MKLNALLSSATSLAMALTLATASSGCKKKSSGSSDVAAPATTVAVDKCNDVSVKVGTALETEVRATAPEEAKEKLTPIFAEIQAIMKTRCSEDKWPDAFTDCVLAAANAEAIGECQLPDEQEKSLTEAMETLTPKIMEAMTAPATAPAESK